MFFSENEGMRRLISENRTVNLRNLEVIKNKGGDVIGSFPVALHSNEKTTVDAKKNKQKQRR